MQGTVLALATTVFYQAKWQQEFSPALTSDAIFHAAGGDVTCDMMQGTYYGNYYWGDHFSAVGKPMEMLLLTAVAFIPPESSHAANALVSFACAMQVEAFRKARGYAYASTMCIGNLRSCMESLRPGKRSRPCVHWPRSSKSVH